MILASSFSVRCRRKCRSSFRDWRSESERVPGGVVLRGRVDSKGPSSVVVNLAVSGGAALALPTRPSDAANITRRVAKAFATIRRERKKNCTDVRNRKMPRRHRLALLQLPFSVIFTTCTIGVLGELKFRTSGSG